MWKTVNLDIDKNGGNRIAVLMICLLYQIFIVHPVEYEKKCPDRSHWRLRSSKYCSGKTEKYHCLYNQIEEKYVELCETPDSLTCTRGRKVVYAGSNFDVQSCAPGRYMPYICTSNETSECPFQKSICSEEGQIGISKRSTLQDATCICDFLNGYSFIIQPKGTCFCIPSEEDCTCYRKNCPDSHKLSSDYTCIWKSESIDSSTCPTRIINMDQPVIQIPKPLSLEDHRKYNLETTQKDHRSIDRCMIVILIFLVLSLGITLFVKGTDIGSILDEAFEVRVQSKDRVKLELYMSGEDLKKKGDTSNPRILDMCFITDKEEIYIVYIDADNDRIVKQSVKNTDNCISERMDKHPNRLTKMNDKEVAVIYKTDYDIIVCKIFKNKIEVGSTSYHVENFLIQGIVNTSEENFILSDKKTIAEYSMKEKKLTPIHAKLKTELDTARRLAIPSCNKGKDGPVFIADENEKMVVSVKAKTHSWIAELKDHDRGLQNVRSIAALKNKLLAATGEGVSVYTHENGKFPKRNERGTASENLYEYSPLLIAYKKNVTHTRSLCIETVKNRIFLGLSCVIDRTDCILVVSFPEDDFYSTFSDKET